jgi:hypothetical protein
MTYVRMNLTRMFAHHEPWDCCNSVANLGPAAGRLTWQCALEVAERADEWLVGARAKALDYICTWARDTGAWERAEIEGWSEMECLALLVQNVASDLRELGADDEPLSECCYEEGSEVAESGCVSLWVWNAPGPDGEPATFGELAS